ncbi:uncharacterized protein LY89DRAFT_671907 [Mollisia scopiformis]|uniref:WW domain-containing protein n=1 Tax=Mollisia scopiformis TaxID=149040 RepID=A0A194X317_MOLSC|nr:uncharacterized protein LY89DRAFT_671907 [Mollisia scopiformis]KUJ14573.1 hypothetical protein LY89DRAFT_671907 [Mollisia scopiformis]
MTSGPPGPPPFPPAGSPPPVPEGWRAEWSNEHRTWYYFNPSTQASTWQNPLNNAPPPPSPPPYANGSNNRDLWDNDEKSSSSTARGFPPVLNRIFGHSHSPAPPPPTHPTGTLPLYIHSACFCDADITQKLRAMITPQQTLSLRCDSLTFHFGDPWPNHRKQFSMLYSYGQQPWQLIACVEGPETINLHPIHPVDHARAAFVQAPNSRVVALVWGAKNALVDPESSTGRSKDMKMMEVEREGRFEASNAWMGFDGAPNMEKMAVVYYRHADGSVGVLTAREGETVRLPWNAFAGAI